jgi:hypothetical protein
VRIVRIRYRTDLTAREAEKAMASVGMRLKLKLWMRSSPDTFRSLYESLGGRWSWGLTNQERLAQEQQVVNRLAEAFGAGTLVAFEEEMPDSPGHPVAHQLPAAQPQEDGPAPVQTPVSPRIQVAAPKIVLVKKAYQPPPYHPHRLEVRLGTDRPFTGTGTLTCSAPARIKLFDAANGGTELALPLNNIPGARLSAGYTVYVEGVAPSASMRDTTLTLTLTPGGEPVSNNPVTDALSCVELTLDLCQYKPTAGGGDPAPLSPADKINPGRNIHLQDARLFAGRALLIVHKAVPNDYSGNVVVTAIGGRVRMFSYADEVPATGQVAQADPLSTPNSTIGANGLRMWVEGSNVSGALRDTGFTLEIGDLPGQEGDRVQMTVVRAVVDVCQSRMMAADIPAPIPLAQKMNPGRFLHLQDPGNNHGRARVIVQRVEPASFVGNLELTVWDVTANSAANPRTRLFAGEAPGGAAHPNPHTVNHTAAYPAAGTELWVEGAVVSGALRDTELRLKVADAEGNGDRAALTVVEFRQIQAKIKPTPSNTLANSAAMVPPTPAPAEHVFTSNHYTEDFAVNEPLVLMRPAQPDIELEVTAAPAGLPIVWAAIRNGDDHVSLGDARSVPAVTQAPILTKATLDANNKGSFRVRPYIDCNGTNTYSLGEPSIPLNLVLADATVHADRSIARPANLSTAINGASVRIVNGSWTAGLPGAGMAMDLDADVTGGGADGRLGLDKVFSGLVNMVGVRDVNATYTDSTVVPPTNHGLRFMAASNTADAGAMLGARPLFAPGDPAPVLYALPLLDSGRPGAGLGGESATMSRSAPHTAVDLPVGQRWTIQCIDSPGMGFARLHPLNASAVLTNIHYHYQFIACFCFWTNITRMRGATGDPADRLYSVLRIVPWDIVGDWTVNYAVVSPTLVATTPHNITSPNAGRSTLDPIGRAQDNGVEVRPPSGIQIAAWDGR